MLGNKDSGYYPTTPNSLPYVYSIKFAGINPVGAVAIVVATHEYEALKAFKNFLFSYNSHLYSENSELTVASVKVFCRAAENQLGKVEILLDGEY